MPDGFYFADSEFHGPLFKRELCERCEHDETQISIVAGSFGGTPYVPALHQSDYKVIAVETAAPSAAR